MNNPRAGLDKEPRFTTIVAINVRFMHACILLLYGWTCWSWTSPEWWGLGIAAILGFAGGTALFVTAAHQIVSIFARERKIAAFKRLGSVARADHMASERDLKERALVE